VEARALHLDRIIQDTGMSGAQFMATTIKAALLYKEDTLKSLARRHKVHPVSLSQMIHGSRPWRRGLLPAILHELDLYLMFKEHGLI